MLSFTTDSFSACSPAISSSTGATILHGPHHSAQKSTSTGLSLCRTSVANVASVTVLVLAPTAVLLGSMSLRSVEQAGRTFYADGGGPGTCVTSSSSAASQRSASS